jgi:hypothetical protein
MESRTVFFPGEISLFIDKEIGIFVDFFSCFSANSINFAKFFG